VRGAVGVSAAVATGAGAVVGVAGPQEGPRMDPLTS
jgi:hypothetical protein